MDTSLVPVVFTPTPAQISEATAKGEGWKGFGYKMALNNMELIFKASNLKPPLPTKVEDIAQADLTLAALKKAQKELVDQRKLSTAQMDKVAGVLMTPEKEVDAYIKQYEAALLPLKQIKRNSDNAAAARTNELKSYRENVQIQYNEFCANCEKAIQSKKSTVYAFALENVHVVDIQKHIKILQDRFTVKEFFIGELKHDDAEKLAILKEIFDKFDPNFYVNKYRNELPALFADFATAKANKTEALLNQASQTQAANADINLTTTMNNVAAGLDAASYSPAPVVYTKGLKQYYVVEMEHTETNMVNIMRAFVANMVTAMPQLRVADCFNITILQMAAALAALKNLDEKFAPEKILFTLKDKI